MGCEYVDKSNPIKYKMKYGWSNVVNKYFKEKNKYCTLVFTNSSMKKNKSRKQVGNYLVGRAHCKHWHDKKNDTECNTECNTEPIIREPCLTFKCVVKDAPQKNGNVRMNIIGNGIYGHTDNEINKRHISGQIRKALGAAVKGRPPSIISNDMFNLVNKDIIKEGNLTDAPTPEQIATIQKEERCKDDLNPDDWLDLVQTR
jgi:hypothetical protein